MDDDATMVELGDGMVYELTALSDDDDEKRPETAEELRPQEPSDDEELRSEETALSEELKEKRPETDDEELRPETAPALSDDEELRPETVLSEELKTDELALREASDSLDEERLRKLVEVRSTLPEETDDVWTRADDDDRFAAMEALGRRVQGLRVALVNSERAILRRSFRRWYDVQRLQSLSMSLEAWRRWLVKEADVTAIRKRRAVRRWRTFAVERHAAMTIAAGLLKNWRANINQAKADAALQFAFRRWKRRRTKETPRMMPPPPTKRCLRRWRDHVDQKRHLRETVESFQTQLQGRHNDERRVVAFGNWLGFANGRRRLLRSLETQRNLRFERAVFKSWRTAAREKKSTRERCVEDLIIERRQRFLRAVFERWHIGAFESKTVRTQLAMALHCWASTLQQRCFGALKKYANLRRRKKFQAQRALAMRVDALQDRGCAAFLAAADEVKASRLQADRAAAAKQALRDQDLARKYAAIWRRNVARRKILRSVTPPPAPVVRPYDATTTRLLPLAKTRRKPRRLTDGLLDTTTISETEAVQQQSSPPGPPQPQQQPSSPAQPPVALPPPVPPALPAPEAPPVPPPAPPLPPPVVTVDVGVGEVVGTADVGLQVDLGPDVDALVAAAVTKRDRQRQRKAAAAVRDLEVKLRSWQNQKSAWRTALRHANDPTFSTHLHAEYQAWWNDVAPQIELCAHYIAVATASAASSPGGGHSSSPAAKKSTRHPSRDDDDIENYSPDHLLPYLM